MARHGNTERRRLFDLYAAQFVAGGCTPDNCFVCPLCRDGCLRSALDGPDPALSLAHVIPRSQGGNLCTLTCTACNNENGAGLESELQNRFRFDDWQAGVGDWPIRMSGEFGQIGASLRISEPGPPVRRLSIYAEEERSDRRIIAALLDGPGPFVGSDGNIRWTLNWSVRNRKGRVAAAIYQSAYLMMFA
ncbi:MAG: HNH endonuclease, partial [Gemmataceae bacterium]|nr:HNH endonuclease [Gemmataceae bacterium]